MMMGAGPALSVHDDSLFELDGNAVDSDNPAPRDGDDWDLIYANAGDSCESISSGALAACSFSHDEVNDSIFTGGGSKDEQEVQTSWRHTDGAVPAKDDLLDAFAAQYDNGHLYFGADRYATNGDAQIGFWFFHNEISLNADGTFSGVHTAHDDGGTPNDDSDDANGDILVLSNFSNGGTVPNIRVFEWYGVNDVRQLDGVPQNSLCGTASDDVACAITSGNGVTSPWPFDPKSGPDNIFSSGAFYEGGVDLEALGFGGDCFSSFLAETRSSTSITATLKDFVLGGLGSCGVAVTTQVSATQVSITTGVVSDTASVLGTGSGSVPNPTGTVDFYLCGPAATAPTGCDETTGTPVAEDVELTAANPAIAESGDITITAPGEYCFFALYSGDDNYGATGDNGVNECFSVSSQPTVVTSQSWVPNDSAAIGSGGGGDLTGTADFRLFESADCTGTAVYQQLDVPVSGASAVTVGTTNPGAPTGYTATVDGTTEYSWEFSYDSTATGQEDIAAMCVEVSTLTIDNDNTPTP